MSNEEIRQLQKNYPCRSQQIRSLVCLLDPLFPSPRTTVIHGLPATGKSSITRAVLQLLNSQYVWVQAKAALTARQIFEEIYRGVANLLSDGSSSKTESLSVLVAKLDVLLRGVQSEKIFIVLDGIDETKEGSPGLLAGLARVGEAVRISMANRLTISFLC
jgi:origin recognition complex subunit 5